MSNNRRIEELTEALLAEEAAGRAEAGRIARETTAREAEEATEFCGAFQEVPGLAASYWKTIRIKLNCSGYAIRFPPDFSAAS